MSGSQRGSAESARTIASSWRTDSTRNGAHRTICFTAGERDPYERLRFCPIAALLRQTRQLPALPDADPPDSACRQAHSMVRAAAIQGSLRTWMRRNSGDRSAMEKGLPARGPPAIGVIALPFYRSAPANSALFRGREIKPWMLHSTRLYGIAAGIPGQRRRRRGGAPGPSRFRRRAFELEAIQDLSGRG